MKAARILVLVGFFLTLSIVAIYKVIPQEQESADPELKQAQIAFETKRLLLEQEKLKQYMAFETERFRLKRANLRRNSDLNFYGALGILCACGVALFILATGYSRARVNRSSVYIAQIGQHSKIPIHQKDLQSFYPIAINLSLAEIEASASTAHDRAYQISRQMLEDITEYTRAIAGKRGMLAIGNDHSELDPLDTSALISTPTFAELLHSETIVPGKPLVLGYDRQAQPQYRSLQDLKSVAIAGWQGSGKTVSMGYIIASSVLAYGVRTYVVDPHKHHEESLYALIKPLENTEYVTVINPFDTPALLDELNTTLDRRLSGQEPSSPGILLVIDEMARLAKLDCFDVLIAFLERCTEETRKANMTFIGGSHKWTARHFKGRADIRGCMNSMLIHKSKPSQADLLLEDVHDKQLVKQLHRPGEAILVTDYDTPTLVSMPFCTPQDMETVAEMLRKTDSKNGSQKSSISVSDRDPDRNTRLFPETIKQKSQREGQPLSSTTSNLSSPSNAGTDERESAPGVIPFARHRKGYPKTHQGVFDPKHLTVQMIQEQLQHRKSQEPHFTQLELARQAGISPSHLSRILRGQRPLNEKHKQRLYEVFFGKTHEGRSNRLWPSLQSLKLKRTAI